MLVYFTSLLHNQCSGVFGKIIKTWLVSLYLTNVGFGALIYFKLSVSQYVNCYLVWSASVYSHFDDDISSLLDIHLGR